MIEIIYVLLKYIKNLTRIDVLILIKYFTSKVKKIIIEKWNLKNWELLREKIFILKKNNNDKESFLIKFFIYIFV